MSFDRKYVNGVVQVEDKRVKLYSTSSDVYITVSVGVPITHAHWSGDTLHVALSTGRTRVYKNSYTYNTV